jgi:hypothetical protein
VAEKSGRRGSAVAIRYTTVRNGNRFFEPSAAMRRHGFRPKPLGPDGPASRAEGLALYEKWLRIKTARNAAEIDPNATRTREDVCCMKLFPIGSIGEAWQQWIQSQPWRDLASSTRNKIWWEAWNKRIEPIFGDVDPNSVTMAQVADWRQEIVEASGIDAAHKALKIWRKLWKVMQSLRYTQLSDPSSGIRNRQPLPRHQRFLHSEAVRLAKRAWRDGYLGLACIIVIAWDTGFAPIDCRTLRRRHRGEDPKNGRIFFDRSDEGREKTGVAVIGTLSRFGDRLVRTYLDRFGAEHHAESLLFRMRTGVAYQESRLGGDFATIRERVFPGDKRQLRDMRRSGVMETFNGGAKAEDVSEKFGNTIDRSNVLFKTYNPVDLEKVRQADAKRLEGRRRRNKN